MGDDGELARERVIERLKGGGLAAPRVAAQAYLEQHPADAEVRAYLGAILVHVCRWDRARPLLVDLMDSEYEFVRIQVRLDLATMAWARGHAAEAERHLRVQAEQDPQYAGGHVRLGELLEVTGRGEEAEQCFREGIGRGTPRGRARAWEALGRLMVRDRRYGDALESLKNSIELEAEEPESRLQIIEDAERAHEIVEEGGHAVDTQDEDVREGPLPKRSPMLRLFKSARYASFRELAQRYLADNPTDNKVRLNLGMALHKLGDHAGARSHLERLLGSEVRLRHTTCARQILGHIGRAIGDYAGAEQHYREALRRDPQAGGHVFIGAILAIQGRLEEALEVHREGTQCVGECVDEAWGNIGLILRAFERYDEAAEALERAIELDPDYDLAKEALADCLEALDLQHTLGIS